MPSRSTTLTPSDRIDSSRLAMPSSKEKERKGERERGRAEAEAEAGGGWALAGQTEVGRPQAAGLKAHQPASQPTNQQAGADFLREVHHDTVPSQSPCPPGSYAASRGVLSPAPTHPAGSAHPHTGCRGAPQPAGPAGTRACPPASHHQQGVCGGVHVMRCGQRAAQAGATVGPKLSVARGDNPWCPGLRCA